MLKGGEILIHARLPTACRLVRVIPYKEGCDEITAEAGSLPAISLAAAGGLLVAGVADFDGYAQRKELPDWFTGGEPILDECGMELFDVVVGWRLADGESAPEISLKDCRVMADAVEELIARYRPSEDAGDRGAPVSEDADHGGQGKPKGGRPPSIRRKAEILGHIIATMEKASGQRFDPVALPGTAADLQDACERIERSKTRKVTVLNGETGTFKKLLRTAGFGFPDGAPLKSEEQFWVRLCVKTMTEIDPKVFTEVKYEKTL